MSDSTIEIERYRDYLLLLTRMQLTPRLRGKVDDSDIVQQVILEAYQCRSQFRGSTEGERLAWLRTILAHMLARFARHYATGARDIRRERSLHDELELSSSRLHDLLIADQTSPSRQAARSEEVVALSQALANLNDDQRYAIELHHLQGLPITEVAERMGRSRPAIAGLLFRGLNKLREQMDARNGE